MNPGEKATGSEEKAKEKLDVSDHCVSLRCRLGLNPSLQYKEAIMARKRKVEKAKSNMKLTSGIRKLSDNTPKKQDRFIHLTFKVDIDQFIERLIKKKNS